MKLFHTTAIVAALIVAAPAMAQDTHYMGSASLTVNTSDPGLVLGVDYLNQNLDFTQGVGDTFSQDLGWIFTNESDVGKDDKVAKSISLNVVFSNPVLSGGLSGQSYGVSLAGIVQYGQVTWNNGGNFMLSNLAGDVVSGHINSGHLGDGLFGLNDQVGLKETLSFTTNAQGAVPEPTSWALMVGGFGMVGGAVRARKRSTSVRFA